MTNLLLQLVESISDQPELLTYENREIIDWDAGILGYIGRELRLEKHPAVMRDCTTSSAEGTTTSCVLSPILFNSNST